MIKTSVAHALRHADVLHRGFGRIVHVDVCVRYVVGLSGGVTQDFVQCVRMPSYGVCLRGDAVVQCVVPGLQCVDLGFQCIQWRRCSRHAFHNPASIPHCNCDQCDTHANNHSANDDDVSCAG